MAAVIAILLFVALVLGVLEAVLPTGGVLGFLAAGCAVAAVWMLFFISTTAGWVGLSAVLLSAVLLPLLGVWVVTRTRFGKRWILSRRPGGMGKDVVLDPQRDGDGQSLVDVRGVTLTACRPVGTCRFGDRTVECLSISGLLEPGIKVSVVSVRGIEVRVRQVS